MSWDTISQWFCTAFPLRGSMKKLNKIPIDKFTGDIIICRTEFIFRFDQVPPWSLVFGDKTPLKVGDLFNRRVCADPLTGLIKDFVVELDWRNTFVITILCWIGHNRPPFSYIIHNGSNNAAVFCDFIFQQLLIIFMCASMSFI